MATESSLDGRPEPNILPAFRDAASKIFAAPTDLLSARELQRRVDSKFLVSSDVAAKVLARAASDYAALQVPGGNLATYQSFYYDTHDFRCFHDHRRGRRLRYKVRVRRYPERGVAFLEVKIKRNDVITDKKRLRVDYALRGLGPTEMTFLAEHLPFAPSALRPAIRIDFVRLSLLGLRLEERATIDTCLTIAPFEDISVKNDVGGADTSAGLTPYRIPGQVSTDELPRFARVNDLFAPLTIFEIKQPRSGQASPMMDALRAHSLRETSVSKFSACMALVHPELRQNRFRENLRAIEHTATANRSQR